MFLVTVESTGLILYVSSVRLRILTMRFELFFLDAVDPSLCRLDYASLSQQALMEMVIDGITNKEKICRDPMHRKTLKNGKVW